MLTGLGAVGLGVWLLAPQYVLSALPLLLVLACPLSMVVMAVMMRGSMGGERLMGMGGARSKVPPDSAAARRDLQPDAAATPPSA